MSIVIVGLGPGGWPQVTLEAREVLQSASKVFVRTIQHPTVAHLPEHLLVESFDALYERSSTFAEVYDSIAQQIIREAQQDGDVVYAVPGHPLVGEATVTKILALAKAAGIPLRIVPGLSFVDSVLPLLEEDALSPGLQMVDAEQPLFDAARPALFCQIFNQRAASELKLTLLDHYPAEHMVTLITAAGVPERQTIERLPLFQLDRNHRIDHLTCLFVPGLAAEENLRSFASLEEIVAKLRAPDGCPWDREQTHATLRPHLIEESYEVLEAIDSGDPDKLCEELGDLLMQVFLHAQLAAETEDFDVHDVVAGIAAKLIRRHPHVFGDIQVANSAEVLVNWEAIKKQEREEGQSMLSGVPKAMPALAYSQAMLKRAGRVGFDGKSKKAMLKEIEKGLRDLVADKDEEQKSERLGQLLFEIGGLARALKTDPEEALREANRRFRQRFERVERICHERGLNLADLSAEERGAIWQEAG